MVVALQDYKAELERCGTMRVQRRPGTCLERFQILGFRLLLVITS